MRVPATSANLGPGFDAVGLALSRYDDVVVVVTDSGLTVDVAGEGADRVPRTERNLVVRAVRAAFDALGGQPPGLELSCANRIPHERGLGSSAAAIVAGLVAARALVPGGALTFNDAALLAMAARLEGHVDNVAACLRGGLTVSWWTGQTASAARLDPAPGLRPVVFVPAERSSTQMTRALLPEAVSHPDAAFTAGRAALLTHALTSAPELLFAATEDRLHQRYRAEAMPEAVALMSALRAAGLPAVISGAGPSVLCFAPEPEPDLGPVGSEPGFDLNSYAPSGWSVHPMSVDSRGARVLTLAG